MKQLILDRLRRWWWIYLLGFLFVVPAYGVMWIYQRSLLAAMFLSVFAMPPCFFAKSSARALMTLPGSRRELATALWLLAILPSLVFSMAAPAILSFFVPVGPAMFLGGILSGFAAAGTVFLIFASFISSSAIGFRWTGWRAHGGVAWILLSLATLGLHSLDFASPLVFVPACGLGLWFTWVGFRHAPELLAGASVKPAESATISFPTFENFLLPPAGRLQGITHELWSAFRLATWTSLAIHLCAGAAFIYLDGWSEFFSKPGLLLPFQPGNETSIAWVIISFGSINCFMLQTRWLIAPRTLRALPLSARQLAMFWIGTPVASSLGLWLVPVVGYVVWAWQLPALAFLPVAFCFAALWGFGASLFLYHGLKIGLVTFFLCVLIAIGSALSIFIGSIAPGPWYELGVAVSNWIEVHRVVLLLGFGTLLMVTAYWLALRGFARRSTTYQRPLIPTALASPI